MEAIVRTLLEEPSAPPVLVYPNWDAVTDNSRPFLLCCDASVDGFGATLEQEQKDGSIRPVLFISRATLESERHWAPLDLDAGRIVWSIKRFLRGHLWGNTFRIFSDDKAFESFAKVPEHKPRHQRWLEFLTAYRYTLEYRKAAPTVSPTFYLGYRCLRRRVAAAAAAAKLHQANNAYISYARAASFLMALRL